MRKNIAKWILIRKVKLFQIFIISVSLLSTFLILYLKSNKGDGGVLLFPMADELGGVPTKRNVDPSHRWSFVFLGECYITW